MRKRAPSSKRCARNRGRRRSNRSWSSGGSKAELAHDEEVGDFPEPGFDQASVTPRRRHDRDDGLRIDEEERVVPTRSDAAVDVSIIAIAHDDEVLAVAERGR